MRISWNRISIWPLHTGQWTYLLLSVNDSVLHSNTEFLLLEEFQKKNPIYIMKWTQTRLCSYFRQVCRCLAFYWDRRGGPSTGRNHSGLWKEGEKEEGRYRCSWPAYSVSLVFVIHWAPVLYKKLDDRESKFVHVNFVRYKFWFPIIYIQLSLSLSCKFKVLFSDYFMCIYVRAKSNSYNN